MNSLPLHPAPCLYPDRVVGGDRHHRHPDRPAAAGRAEGARGGGPHAPARTTSSRSAWPFTTTIPASGTLPAAYTLLQCPRPGPECPVRRQAGRPVAAANLLPYIEQEALYRQLNPNLSEFDTVNIPPNGPHSGSNTRPTPRS